MILSSPNVDIRKDTDFGSQSLYFVFKGKFTEQASIVATKAWGEYMDQYPQERFVMVWDCMQMDGFEMNARKKWYEYMKVYSGRIEYIHVISSNILIRGAARVMLEYFGVRGEIVKSLELLKEKAL